MSYQFDQPVDRRGSLSVKWNKDAIRSVCANENAQPFWVADMDFKVAPEIQREVERASAGGIYGYPHFDGVKEAFCAFAKARHGLSFTPEMVTTFPGVLVSISMLVQLMTKEGEGVIVPTPAYKPFIDITQSLGRTLIPWPMRYDHTTRRFALDWEMFDALAKRARMVLFCSPQNPSGNVFSPEELHLLAQKAEEHHLAIVCDEIHADLAFTKHTSMAEIADSHHVQCAVCMAPSKTFNVAGEHFSVVVTKDAALREGMERMKTRNRIEETSFFSTTVALASYKYGHPWLQELIPYLEENANTIENYFAQHCPSLAFVKPSASFIGLIDCTDALPLIEKDAKEHPDLYDPKKSPSGGIASRFFGIRANVCCNDGTWFGGEEYRAFVRFNFGVCRARVLEALERMTAALS